MLEQLKPLNEQYLEDNVVMEDGPNETAKFLSCQALWEKEIFPYEKRYKSFDVRKKVKDVWESL